MLLLFPNTVDLGGEICIGKPSIPFSVSWLCVRLLMGSGKIYPCPRCSRSLLQLSRQRTPVLRLPLGTPPESVSHKTQACAT